MSNNDTIGSTRRDGSDWTDAWEAVRRLAEARRIALDDIEAGVSIRGAVTGALAKPLASFEQDQLNRDIAEIEKASAALRRVEPALQAWAAETPEHEPRRPRSVWILVGTIWISTVLVTGSAIGAILYLV